MNNHEEKDIELVFIHGYGGSNCSWIRINEHFSSKYKINYINRNEISSFVNSEILIKRYLDVIFIFLLQISLSQGMHFAGSVLLPLL